MGAADYAEFEKTVPIFGEQRAIRRKQLQVIGASAVPFSLLGGILAKSRGNTSMFTSHCCKFPIVAGSTLTLAEVLAGSGWSNFEQIEQHRESGGSCCRGIANGRHTARLACKWGIILWQRAQEREVFFYNSILSTAYVYGLALIPCAVGGMAVGHVLGQRLFPSMASNKETRFVRRLWWANKCAQTW